MKRTASLAFACALIACGGGENGASNNGTTNNGTTNNGASNNGTPNGTSNNGTSTNGTPNNSSGGEGFFATYTIDGEDFEANCPTPAGYTPGAPPTEGPPYFASSLVGDQFGVGCYTESVPFAPFARVFWEDAAQLAGGAVDENSFDGLNFQAVNPSNMGVNYSVECSSPGVCMVQVPAEEFTFSGNYDEGTRRMTGTFSGTWANGSAEGNYDFIVPSP